MDSQKTENARSAERTRRLDPPRPLYFRFSPARRGHTQGPGAFLTQGSPPLLGQTTWRGVPLRRQRGEAKPPMGSGATARSREPPAGGGPEAEGRRSAPPTAFQSSGRPGGFYFAPFGGLVIGIGGCRAGARSAGVGRRPEELAGAQPPRGGAPTSRKKNRELSTKPSFPQGAGPQLENLYKKVKRQLRGCGQPQKAFLSQWVRRDGAGVNIRTHGGQNTNLRGSTYE